jgi:hypothetical protein
VKCIFTVSALASLLIVASSMALAAAPDIPLPQSEVPGSSAAGGRGHEGTGKSKRQPTPVEPTPQIRGWNFPTPEPVAPKKNPDSPPPLPGSGRRDVVPGS